MKRNKQSKGCKKKEPGEIVGVCLPPSGKKSIGIESCYPRRILGQGRGGERTVDTREKRTVDFTFSKILDVHELCPFKLIATET